MDSIEHAISRLIRRTAFGALTLLLTRSPVPAEPYTKKSVNPQLLLKYQTVEEVKKYTEAQFDEIYAQLTPEQRSKVTHDQVARDVLDTLNDRRRLAVTSPLVPRANTAECIEDVLLVVVDCIGIVMTLIGIGSSESEAVGNAMAAELREDQQAINGLAKIMNTLETDADAKAKALAIWKIFSAVIRYTGVKSLFKAIKHEFHWYDWIIVSISIIGQISLWCATEGVAAVAEIVLLIEALATTGLAIAKSVKDCGSIDHNVPEPPLVRGSTILAGQRLNPNECIMSPDGKSSLVMQRDGNLVIYQRDKGPVFSSHTNSNEFTGNYAIVQHDGNFCVNSDPENSKPKAMYCIHNQLNQLSGDNCRLVLMNDAHLRLFDAAGTVVWRSPFN